MVGLGQMVNCLAGRFAGWPLFLWAFLGCLWLSGFGFAQSQEPACADQPYTLEVTQLGSGLGSALVGGGNLEYQDDVAYFSDGACLQTQGIRLQAPELRFDPKTGILETHDLEVQTPRYRFWAKTGIVKGNILEASGIRATTCKCGDNLQVRSDSLSFDTESGEVVLEQSQLEAYGFGLASFSHLRFRPDAPLNEALGLGSAESDLASLIPLRLYFDQGLNVGVEDFNLALLSNAENRTPLRFSILATALGSSLPSLKMGFSTNQDDGYARISATVNQASTDTLAVVAKGPVFFTFDTVNQQYAFRIKQPFVYEGILLTPFAQAAYDHGLQGLAYGAKISHLSEQQQDNFRLRFEPFVSAIFYDDSEPYVALGGRFSIVYSADYNLEVAYSGVITSRSPRYWLEALDVPTQFKGAFQYQNTDARIEVDFLKEQTSAGIHQKFQTDFGEFWAEGWLRYRSGVWQRQELLVGFKPNPLTCTDSLSLSPTLGYDFSRQGISRAGLEVHYADCCFVWKVGYSQVFFPNLAEDEVATGRWTFGLEIR